jgi:hypothetical protein
MKGVVGTFERTTKPKLQRQDSAIKRSLRKAMARGRKFRPAAPKLPDRVR